MSFLRKLFGHERSAAKASEVAPTTVQPAPFGTNATLVHNQREYVEQCLAVLEACRTREELIDGFGRLARIPGTLAASARKAHEHSLAISEAAAVEIRDMLIGKCKSFLSVIVDDEGHTLPAEAEKLLFDGSQASANVDITRRRSGEKCVIMKRSYIDAKLCSIDPACFRSPQEKEAKIVMFAGSFAKLTQEANMAHVALVRTGKAHLLTEAASGDEIFDSPPSDWHVPCYMVVLAFSK